MLYKKYIIALLLFTGLNTVYAQEEANIGLPVHSSNGWEVELRLGVNIGGAAPLPMPKEIRKIEGYNPKFNGTVEGTITKWLGKNEKWGASVGLKLEKKGM